MIQITVLFSSVSLELLLMERPKLHDAVVTCFRCGGDRGKALAEPVQLVDCIVFVWFVGREELVGT